MTANNIIDTCQILLLDIYKITQRDIIDLCFVMNTKHLKTISEHYGYDFPKDKIIETKILGHEVIHNECVPMYEIYLGFKKDIKKQL
jgi:hypothetical protein